MSALQDMHTRDNKSAGAAGVSTLVACICILLSRKTGIDMTMGRLCRIPIRLCAGKETAGKETACYINSRGISNVCISGYGRHIQYVRGRDINTLTYFRMRLALLCTLVGTPTPTVSLNFEV